MIRLIIDPQLFSVVFHIEDTQGQAWEIRVDEDWSKSGSGDTIFNESFSTGQHTAILRGIAFPAQTVVFIVKAVEAVEPPKIPPPPPPVFNPKPSEPLPLAPKEETLGSIGSSCDMINNYSFARSVYYGRNRYTGETTAQSMDYETARGSAERSSICQQTPPPTAKDWQDGIQKQVTAGFDALSKYVTDGLKSVTDSAQKGILDLEARMKAWISESIFELLMKNLNASAIEYKKQRGKT